MSAPLTIPVRITYLAGHVLIEVAPNSPGGVTVAVPMVGEEWQG